MAEEFQGLKIVIGKNYYIRGIRDYVARVVGIDGPKCVSVEDAAWISEAGRLGEFVANGRTDPMEVEYMGKIKGSIWYDEIWEWPHPLFLQTV